MAKKVVNSRQLTVGGSVTGKELEERVVRPSGANSDKSITEPTSHCASEATSGLPLSDEADQQELFLPVTGFVWLFPEEIEVVNHPVFQRLGRIYQLGQVHLVYRGATHKRIEHSLGTLHLAHQIIKAIRHTSSKAARCGRQCGEALKEHEERFVRLGALLHDIGHIAAGHTIEDELGLIPRHDEDKRLDLLFEGTQWVDSQRRTLAQVIDINYAKYIPAELTSKQIKPSVVAKLLIRKIPESAQDKYESEQTILSKSDEIRLAICRDIIGNTICADLLDYIFRDWYHMGKPHPFENRILQYMEIRAGKAMQRGPKSSDRFVISLGVRPKIRTDAVSAILELLESRYRLAEAALFHRTKLAATGMLDRALFALWEGSDNGVEEMLLPLSDEQMLAKCRELARQKGGEKGKLADYLLGALERRELFSGLLTHFHDSFSAEQRAQLEATYVTAQDAAQNRDRALALLESDFGLEPGSLAMYCPKLDMNVKIARVQIALSDEVLPFDEFERKHGRQLSGGHLEAQVDRFHRLWRVHLFIKRAAMAKLGTNIHLLRQAIDKLVLGNFTQGENYEGVLRQFAVLMTAQKGSPWYGKEVLEESVAAAYRDAGTATGRYPLGAPSIRSYIS